MSDDRRLADLRAALGFVQLPPRAPELRLLPRWLDTWAGLGLVVAGVATRSIRFPHRGHASTSMSKTRGIRSAHGEGRTGRGPPPVASLEAPAQAWELAAGSNGGPGTMRLRHRIGGSIAGDARSGSVNDRSVMMRWPMIIAISETLGSLGSEIGRHLAQELSWEFADREILAKASTRYGEGVLDLAHVTESKPNLWERFTDTTRRYQRYVEATIFEMAARDNVVLSGRASTILLRPIRHAVRVRVNAPEAVRAERVEQQQGMVHEAALDLVAQTDLERAARVKFVYGADWNDTPILRPGAEHRAADGRRRRAADPRADGRAEVPADAGVAPRSTRPEPGRSGEGGAARPSDHPGADHHGRVPRRLPLRQRHGPRR